MTRPESLRELALEQDATAAATFELGRLWQELCRGTWLFHDTFTTDERYLAIVAMSAEAPPRPLDARKLKLLEAVLLGTPPKVVAMDCHRALSSVTSAIQDCLRAMGLPIRGSRTPVLLTMAARARLRPDGCPALGRLSTLVVDGTTYRVVSATRPDLRFPVPLSLAEKAVLQSLLAGDSYAQISGARATSPRTVANQLATAFRKLGVSGRRAAIGFVLEHHAGQEAPG